MDRILELQQAILRNRAELGVRLETLRDRDGLPDGVKQRLIGEAYDAAKRRHAALTMELQVVRTSHHQERTPQHVTH